MEVKYNEALSTSLIFLPKEGFGEQTILELLNSLANIEGYVENRYNGIGFITIFPVENKEKQFEKSKIDLIKKLNDVSDYLSILHDAETVIYMKEMSERIYHLERELRALIEIIFLKNKGKNWYNTYFEDIKKENNRSEKRPDVIRNLKNPLDNRNFVDLVDFISNTIKSSKNSILHKLDFIEEILVSVDLKNEDSEKQLLEIHDLLKEIKKSTDLRKEGISINDLYEHLTPTLSSEWKELYSHRNLWAHNYCLFTKEEYAYFKKLSSSVIRKIRTEITLLSLFDDNDTQPFIIGTRSCSFNLHKFKYDGSSTCKFKIKFNLPDDKSYLYEIPRATFKDIIEVSTVFSEIIEDKRTSTILKSLSSNPFLTIDLKRIIEEVLDSNALERIIREDFSLIQKKLKDTYLAKLLKDNIIPIEETLEKKEAKMNDDLNSLLLSVFN
ncbi:hypothetical protein A6P54_17800 [Bacillus sp. MKU004]|nr:hypothetical protein A6P54_17800 [Bacillus sp. MKU004]